MSPLFVAVRRAALLCLSLAAVFTAGVTFSPHVYAQGPGGGYPSGPTPGWSAVPRTGTTGQYLSDFDWIGLYVTRKVNPFPSSNMPPINSTQNPAYLGWNSGGYPIEYTFQGTGGTSSSAATAHLSVTGSIGFRWLWTPGINPATNKPDLSLFPMPPLFVLGKGFVSMTRMLEYGTMGAGLTVTGTDTDGFGGSWAFTSALHDVEPPSGTPPGRGVLTASPVDATHTSASVSPSIHIDTSGTLPGDTSAELASATAAALPITLSAPDPFGRPDLGDGKNQYVYDATSPNSQLLLPGTIEVTGADASDTAWLMRGDQNSPDVALVLDLPAETKPMDSSLRDQTICSVVPADQIMAKHGSLSAPIDGFLYAGLPTHNSDFGGSRTPGYHTEKMTVNGTDSEIAHIQTFFTGIDGSGNFTANYPNAAANKAPDGNVIPNWYYYYNQASTASGSYEADTQAEQASHIDLTSPFAPHLHNDAYNSGATYSLPVFDLDAVSPYYVRCVGHISIRAIHSYIWVSAHEKGHQTLSNQTDANGKPVYNWSNDANGAVTNGEDHLSTVWKTQHHLNPNVSDTTAAYGNLGGGDVADDEVVADIPALGALLSNAAAWQNDWADPGLQWGGGNPLYFNPKPTGTQEGFYWTFTASISGTAAQGAFQTGNSYHIHNLSDLTAQYSRVLMSLP